MKYLSFFTKKTVLIPLVIVAVIIISIVVYKITHKPVYETGKAEKIDFVQEVSVTGNVVAASDVNLAFESGGKVSSVLHLVGTKVKSGSALAYVNNSDLDASLLGAQARLQSAQADFESVVRGTRTLELSNLENTFSSSKTNLIFAINNAYAVSDDQLRIEIDDMYTDATGVDPKFTILRDITKRNKLERDRVNIGDMLEKWKRSISALSVEKYNDTYYVEAKSNLAEIKKFIEDLAEASSNLVGSNTFTEAEIAVFVANISAARISINSAINSFNTASQSYITAQGNLGLAKDGSTSEEISRAEAAVKNAQASVLQAKASLLKTSIVAPFSGIITKTDLKVGQFVSPGAPVISMISDAKFGIESYIPEADISKIGIGFTGTTTLDAYGDSAPFQVVVTAIDLSETVVEGVTTYKTTLQFVDTDDRIRSGMTANIDLKSATRQGILSIPQTAIISTKGIRTVLVLDSKNNTQSRVVTTGSIDNTGHIEIKNGLEAGETIVTNPPK